MPNHDRHHSLFDAVQHLVKQFGLFNLVLVQSSDQFAASVADDLAGQRNALKRLEGARIEFKRALVFEFLKDVLLDNLERSLGIDEVVMEELLQ